MPLKKLLLCNSNLSENSHFGQKYTKSVQHFLICISRPFHVCTEDHLLVSLVTLMQEVYYINIRTCV